jgi:Amiloride-sensitive sodium channel
VSGYRALYLIVHNQTSQPVNIINDGILLSPGQYHTIGIDRTFNKKASKPYSDCIERLEELGNKNSYSKRLLEFFKDLNISQYDQNVCFNLCQQDQLIDHCGCSDLTIPSIRNTLYCMSDKEVYECMHSFYSEHLTSVFTSSCMAACPEKCNTLEYELTVNNGFYTTLNSMKYLKYFPRFTNLPDVDNTLLWYGHQAIMALDINYQNMYYTK